MPGRALALVLLLAACAEVPAIDARIPEAERRGPPPPLLPLGPILARADLPAAADPSAGLGARAAALAARAAALRDPLLDADAQQRLASGVATGELN